MHRQALRPKARGQTCRAQQQHAAARPLAPCHAARLHHQAVVCQQQKPDGSSSSTSGSNGTAGEGNAGPSTSGRGGLLPPLLSLFTGGRAGIAGASLASVAVPTALVGGGGSGGGWFGNGGGGGGGGGGAGAGPSQQLYELAADDKEDSSEEEVKEEKAEGSGGVWKKLITDSEEVEGSPEGRGGTRRCVEVSIQGWPSISAIPTEAELRESLNVQEGHIFDYQDVLDDRRRLEMQYDDYIAGVEIRTEYVDEKTNHQRVVYTFTPHQFSGIDSIEIAGSTLMPAKVMKKICSSCLPKDPYLVDVGIMETVRKKIEDWYHDRGLPFCYVGFFDGMDEGVLRANVTEAKVNDVSVTFMRRRPKYDESSDEVEYYQQGKVVKSDRIVEAAGFKKGEHYHVDDTYDAMNNIYACGLLDDIHIEPEQDQSDVTKINVKILAEEVQPKSMELDLDWAIQLNNGVPKLSRQALIPGGSVELSHENLFGNSESATLSLSASDWRNPAADLGYSLSYTEPFYAPHTTRNAQIFNTRKLSTVFTSGEGSEVPPVYVDRFGIKGWTSYTGGQDNKVEHALMLQRINTVDEQGQPLTRGTKVLRGYYADNGPPTTLSPDGRDLSLSYQGYTALDDVQFVNGNQLGRRVSVQVDQGLNPRLPLPGGGSIGLSGGIYNRVLASYTKFTQIPFLKQLTEEDVFVSRKAPNTLVLHARAGNCIGDMASYDYFALGGPYSVRGYNHGEIAASRRFLEASAEVRVPLKNFGLPGQAYAFVDYATDLGASSQLAGNPTEYYRKAGSGMGVGAGVKVLGACRVEYARDCNAGKGTVFVNFGERY